MGDGCWANANFRLMRHFSSLRAHVQCTPPAQLQVVLGEKFFESRRKSVILGIQPLADLLHADGSHTKLGGSRQQAVTTARGAAMAERRRVNLNMLRVEIAEQTDFRGQCSLFL